MNQLSRVILFSACYILCISAFAQCPDVDAGPDQTSCTIPGVFTLSGSSSSTPIETTWSPITGLSDPNSLTTIATVAVETEYVLTVKSINYDINYVVNGDFMDGNVNFTTDYDFHDNPTFPGNELIE
ncbi:hypothetical protein N9B82_06600, partial [Saprospiraceae bacterium]|nr:hypothetical protein [Saprospiraceae bacterium]